MNVRAKGLNGWARVSVAVAAFAVVLPAATYAAVSSGSTAGRPGAVAFSFNRSFTPAQADPRLVAALSNRPLITSEFNFTPTAAKKRASQVRIAIRAQAMSPRASSETSSRTANVALASAAAVTALTPAAYNLGAGVGWRRFAVDGDVARVKPDALGLGGRDGALVGINYSLNHRLTGRVAASADRSEDRVPALSEKRAYAVDVGGAFDINRRLSVTGGVRYRVEKDRLSVDQRRDSQAIYLGTALKF